MSCHRPVGEIGNESDSVSPAVFMVERLLQFCLPTDLIF